MQKKYGTSWNHKPDNRNRILLMLLSYQLGTTSEGSKIGFALYIFSVSTGLAKASAAIPTIKIAATIRNAESNEPDES